MIHSSTELLKINPFNSDLNLLKLYTVVSTRPDLCIEKRIAIDWFTPYEYNNKHDWRHDHFNYDISELGFRDIDLPKEIDLAAFGCSFTFGQGMPNDLLWHKLISRKHGIQSYNFGQPAASIKTIADMISILIQHVKIKRAVILLPPYHRQLVAATNIHDGELRLLPIIPNYTSNLEKSYKIEARQIYKYVPDEEMLKTFKDNLYLIEMLCKTNNVKMYCSSWDRDTYSCMKDMSLTHGVLLPEWSAGDVDNYLTDLARDFIHPGIKHHESWANKIESYFI